LIIVALAASLVADLVILPPLLAWFAEPGSGFWKRGAGSLIRLPARFSP
jgi:hypothetical protein